MGAVGTNPYTSQTIAAYNTSPPPDDGSQSSDNKLEWAKHKTKLADPVKTLSEAINSAVSTAFAKGVNTDAGVRNQLSGSLAFEWATATIAVDVIAANASAIAVGAESGATQDTLQQITATGVYSGALLVLKQHSATEEINVIHATSTAATATDPNIHLANSSDFLIDKKEKSLTLQYDDQVATATGWYETARGGSGEKIVQVVNTQDGAVATGTTTMPFDDTIPQNTEGDEYMTQVITPTDASNILEITVVVNAASSAQTQISAALFQDSTADALAAGSEFLSDANQTIQVGFKHRMTAGTTSATTLKVRVGGASAGTTTFNGQSAARRFGGVMTSSITIKEIAI